MEKERLRVVVSASNQDWDLASTSNLVNLGGIRTDEVTGFRVPYYAEGLADKISYRPGLLTQSDAAKKMVWYILHFCLGDLVRDDW